MYTLTLEQQERRNARRANFKALVQRLKGMTEEERNDLSNLSVINPEGHVLSPINCSLINLQRPGCTIVAGYRQWSRYNRYVRHGERGISIWIPLNVPKEDDEEMPDRIMFSSTVVFDVVQTEEFSKEDAPRDADTPRVFGPVLSEIPPLVPVGDNVFGDYQ